MDRSVHPYAGPRTRPRRPASPAGSGRTANRFPRARRPARLVRRRPRPGPDRSETRGRDVPLGYRETWGHLPDGSGCRARASPHTSSPPWRVRALLEGSRRWVEARTVVRRSRSAAGRAPSEMSQRRPKSACRVGGSGTESSVAVTRGSGRPVTACSGSAEDGVQRLAAVVAQCCCGAAVEVLRGTSSRRSPGTGSAAPAGENPGPGRTPGHPASGPVRPPPTTSGRGKAGRWPGSVQAVRPVLRRGRPLLRGGPAAFLASRPTTPDRGEGAPRRGKAPRA